MLANFSNNNDNFFSGTTHLPCRWNSRRLHRNTADVGTIRQRKCKVIANLRVDKRLLGADEDINVIQSYQLIYGSA